LDCYRHAALVAAMSGGLIELVMTALVAAIQLSWHVEIKNVLPGQKRIHARPSTRYARP
jgi:hypothetical protein